MGDSFQHRYQNQIRCLAKEMLKEELPVLTNELFSQFEDTGNRLAYEEVYFKRRKFLAVYGMAAYIWKRPEDCQKLAKVIEDICREECWALPAHVSRGKKGWELTVDLFAAETAQALAEITVMVNAELPKEVALPTALCERVREEIERRVFLPFFSSKANYGCWEGADHNWNAVCSGSIGSACLYLMAGRDEERLRGCLRRICRSLAYYLDGFREDGACMEGIGYFTYGMSYFAGFAEQLLRQSKGAVDLFESEKVQRIAEFQQKMYVYGGKTISFSDGEQEAKYRMGLTQYLAGRYATVQVPDLRLAADFETDSCYRFMTLMRDYLWTKDLPELTCGQESSLAAAGQPRQEVLPYAEWCICESRTGCSFAIKGGSNDEPHNHNDIGSFCYYVRGESFLTDLGAGEYTRDYFGKGRYEILCNSSKGHSVPIIGGNLQKEGAEYRAGSFYADQKGNMEIEFSGAYTGHCVERLLRRVEFSFEDGAVTVTDAYELPKETDSFTEQLVTQKEVIQEAKGIRLKGKGCDCLLTFSENIRNLRCEEVIHRNHSGEEETVRLIQWDVILQKGKENKGRTCFRVSVYEI